MRETIKNWWNTENEGYSSLVGEKTTHGMIVATALAIFGFTLLIGLAQMVEGML